MKNAFVNLFLILFSIMCLVSCGDSDDEKGGEEYNPSKPTELLSFYPDSGKYLEKVILIGKNFGNDPSKIKVYFNSRRAAVIGSTGSRMYVLAPRLPGDTCDISVVVGKDSLIYPDFFRYKTSVTVTTIAGNGNKDGNAFKEGPFGEAVIQPRYVCVDKDDNVFVVNRVENAYHVLRVDEEASEISVVARGVVANVPAAAPETGIISFPTETTVGSFYTLDPQEFWAPRFREMRWPEGSSLPANGWKHSMVVNPDDGYIYTRYYYGEIVRIHPKSFELEVLYKSPQGDSFGLTFNPLRPNILYISMWGNAGVNAHSICSMDVTDPENTFQRISSSNIAGGHRDGELSIAQFRDPSQIFCDADGNMYIADSGNHCIRRITPEGMVETTLGMPGTRGWKDGSKEEALFNVPTGIGISSDGSVYVADFDNARIRKLSIN
ncbi:MAG: IPT/TIG domain-containing protein [Prevotella sp.]|nr:IPT/TIG domain-containing protein [Prevotella sp.]